MAHAEVQSLGVYKFVLNWLSIMWLKKVRYQPKSDPHSLGIAFASPLRPTVRFSESP